MLRARCPKAFQVNGRLERTHAACGWVREAPDGAAGANPLSPDHPLKLVTDWSTAFVAAWLLWRHELAWVCSSGSSLP